MKVQNGRTGIQEIVFEAVKELNKSSRLARKKFKVTLTRFFNLSVLTAFVTAAPAVG